MYDYDTADNAQKMNFGRKAIHICSPRNTVILLLP